MQRYPLAPVASFRPRSGRNQRHLSQGATFSTPNEIPSLHQNPSSGNPAQPTTRR
ncbi:hypothetical protein [Rubritalea tangerina]|uniref:hypothetical protein n=1 Tax=Rubritalea tangerina TaxID=430798 RepID=UPI0036184A1C